MPVIPRVPRPAALNRRRRVRQRVHAPAYATFSGRSAELVGGRNGMLDLCEVLDISEVGVSIQCPSQMEVNEQIDLCLDLAEAGGPISATARVVWSDQTGRVGFCLPVLGDAAFRRLREWLFLNSLAAAANAASAQPAAGTASEPVPGNQKYNDTLSAAAAVIKETESMGASIEPILSLIASRSNTLLRASGTAIALSARAAGKAEAASGRSVPGQSNQNMICRASAGSCAPPVGTILHVGSGFSGECVRTKKTLCCVDAETDDRVDRDSCRHLGIRSLLAVPIVADEKAVGLIEVFSAQSGAFDEKDGAVLRRFAEAILAALNRATSVRATPAPSLPSPKPSWAPPGSILFAPVPEKKSRWAPKADEEKSHEEKLNEEPWREQSFSPEQNKSGRVRFSRAYLYFLITVAAVVALALGFVLAPWIHQKLQARSRNADPIDLASSQLPLASSRSIPPNSSPRSTNLDQLRDLAQTGDPAAENALGLMYAQGDEKQGVEQNESEAAHWFIKAAEHGSVPAQYKLGLLFWGGHGVPKDTNKAYFWTVLARAGGQQGSQDLAKVLANGMTRAQAATIEQQAEIWYQQHKSGMKSDPGN